MVRNEHNANNLLSRGRRYTDPSVFPKKVDYINFSLCLHSQISETLLFRKFGPDKLSFYENIKVNEMEKKTPQNIIIE